MNQRVIEQIVSETLAEVLETTKSVPLRTNEIPIAISARHIHLKQEHVEHLFGKGTELTVKKMLSQPGQFAANETLIVVGPKGSVSNVRVLGPARSLTQVEISNTDAITLGIQPPIRESGKIEGSASCTLVGPKGSLFLQEGVIIAQAHIHMSPIDAAQYGVSDGEYVSIQVNGIRTVLFGHVKVRVEDRYVLEMHIDTDEANAGFLKEGATGIVVKTGIDGVQTKAEPEWNKQQDYLEIHHRVVTEQDIVNGYCKTIVVQPSAILTDLAKETAKNLGIEIQYTKG